MSPAEWHRELRTAVRAEKGSIDLVLDDDEHTFVDSLAAAEIQLIVEDHLNWKGIPVDLSEPPFHRCTSLAELAGQLAARLDDTRPQPQ